MDYEKAYKESFEAAKGLHDAGNALTKKQMDIVFPQLAESEDERIRRTLVEYFGPEVQLDFVRGVPIRKIRDWLEKQKEQKPVEWSEEDEEMLNSCISSIEESKENRYAYKETDGDTSYDREVDWLESLRNRVGKESLQPHWKPTEELIARLEQWLKDKQFDGDSRSVYPIFESLYKLLKLL